MAVRVIEGPGNPTPIASNAPYVWSADGSALDRWPTNLAPFPPAHFPSTATSSTGETPETIAPGGIAFARLSDSSKTSYNNCPGDVTASSDLSHFVFASEWNVFAPGGQLSAPGSVYDNDTVAGTVAVASKTPAGEDIPASPPTTPATRCRSPPSPATDPTS